MAFHFEALQSLRYAAACRIRERFPPVEDAHRGQREVDALGGRTSLLQAASRLARVYRLRPADRHAVTPGDHEQPCASCRRAEVRRTEQPVLDDIALRACQFQEAGPCLADALGVRHEVL